MALGRGWRGAVWPLAVAAVLGLAISIFDYFWQDNGIHGTLGVALVIGSTLLMAVASVVIAAGWARGWVRTLLFVLIVIDIFCTGFAAYMLEADILLAPMVLALLAWLFAVFRHRRPRRLVSAEVVS